MTIRRVVELVGDASGESSGRLQLLGLMKLVLDPDSLADVARHGDDLRGLVGSLASSRLAGRLEPGVPAVFSPDPVTQGSEDLPRVGNVVGVEKIVDDPAEELFREDVKKLSLPPAKPGAYLL